MAAHGARAAGRAHAAHRCTDVNCLAGSGTPPHPRRFCRGCSSWAGPRAAILLIDTRWGAGDANRIRRYAGELVALGPDVILAPWQRDFGAVAASDPRHTDRVRACSPIRSAPATSIAWRGRAATPLGLPTTNTASVESGWNCLKQVAPGVTRVGVIRDATISAGLGLFAAIHSLAPSVGIEVIPINVRDVGEIERAIANFARSPNGGLIVTSGPLAVVHRDLIITLSAQHKLPTVYYERSFVTDGGLISYGPNLVDQFRRATGYVDRILKGAMPADLPVQAPTTYDLAINLKAAKAIGLAVPPSVLARADEVIE